MKYGSNERSNLLPAVFSLLQVSALRPSSFLFRRLGSLLAAIFLFAQGGGLAGGTGDDDAAAAAGELGVEQAGPGVEVEVAGRRERGGQRGDAAGKVQR